VSFQNPTLVICLFLNNFYINIQGEAVPIHSTWATILPKSVLCCSPLWSKLGSTLSAYLS